jgi:DNA-binding transcriptional regulator YdaS (Cro superfamily)
MNTLTAQTNTPPCQIGSVEEALDQVIAVARLGSRAGLADWLGITKANLYQWVAPGGKVPLKYCPVLAQLSGYTVRCVDLRPDMAVFWSIAMHAGLLDSLPDMIDSLVGAGLPRDVLERESEAFIARHLNLELADLALPR